MPAALDRKICRDFPIVPVRVFWCRLWIREDEFHPSLEIDSEIIHGMDPLQLFRHRKDLVRRRIAAHRRQIETKKPRSA